MPRRSRRGAATTARPARGRTTRTITGPLSSTPTATTSRPSATAPLLDVVPGDRPGDDQPLDLRGALEDRVDLRVAVHALHRELARVTVAAEDLDRPLGRPDGDLAGLQLRHRALGVLKGHL